MEIRRRTVVDALFIGVVGGLSAWSFDALLELLQKLLLGDIAGYRPLRLAEREGAAPGAFGPHGLWLIPVATVVGGLLSGFLVFTFVPEAEGHGTDTAIKSFHRQGGRIRPRVAPLKMLASALTIGSGGAAGREGPIALIAAGFGSLYASFLKRPERERRLLVLIGLGAGLSAMFRAPIGSALFSIEVLYADEDFEAGALLYAMLACIVAFVLIGLLRTSEPMFRVPVSIRFAGSGHYLWYAVLGLPCALLGAALPTVFYKLHDGFLSLRIPPVFKPALGALGVGLIALAVPQVLGGGYGYIQRSIDGVIPVRVMLLCLAAKLAAFPLTVSSGGSGGVFAPTLFMGAMLGGSLAKVCGQPVAAFAIAGMAATFGAAARAPIATLVMVMEMTGNFQLLVPTALSVFLAYLISDTLTGRAKYRSLYHSQVPGREASPAHRAD